jgi:zona occludens toxin
MIEIITGVPGSGKTYKAMYALYSNFAKSDKSKDNNAIFNDVDSAYTNINEIKLDKFNNVYTLNWNKFYSSLEKLYLKYKEDLTDTELIEIAKEENIYRVLLIIDECHNYLDNQDKILIWWLSYHRHLHQQIYLITQNLSLINSKYKSFSEFFYLAFPSSLKLFNNVMKYSQYTSSRLSKVSKTSTIKIPLKKEVFDTYGSGAMQKQSNVILKIIITTLIFLIFAIIILFFYYEQNSIKSEDNITSQNNTSYNETSINNIDNRIITDNISKPITKKFNNDSQEFYMRLMCSITQEKCYYKDKVINLKFYLNMNEKYNFEEITTYSLKNTNFVILEVFVNEKFYYIYNKKEKKTDEISTFNTSIIPNQFSR